MLHRRSTAIAAPVLGLALAASMSACGFHYPTDRVNLISAGENNREHSVYALGMRVLSDQPGEGRLIGNLSNEETSTAALTAVKLPDGIKASFSPIKIAGQYSVNLATQADVALSGHVVPGTVIMGAKLVVTRNGKPETIQMNLPVVKDCQQYTAVPTPSSQSGQSGQSSTSPTSSASGKSGKSAKSGGSAQSSSPATASTSSSASAPSTTPSAPSTTGSDNAWACTWTTPSDTE